MTTTANLVAAGLPIRRISNTTEVRYPMSVASPINCPTCGSPAIEITWTGACECHNCGAEWNKSRERRDRLRRKRDEWEQKTGVWPSGPTASSVSQTVDGEAGDNQ